jgi:nucleoside-diphosphate-sugar epimerase
MKIGIIGCGWLGLPLGEFLAIKGNKVTGSTTSISKIASLEKAGIEPVLLKLNPELECENFDLITESEVIIINIPPRTAKFGEAFHLSQMHNLVDAIKKNNNQKFDSKILFISSTSVYPDANQVATEISEVLEKSVLIKVENLLKANFEKVTVLRCGGLMGYDRFPGKYYTGKPFDNWASGVNYLHRDDAIRVIWHIMQHNIWNETFNVCSPEHPSRKEILIKNCTDLENRFTAVYRTKSACSFQNNQSSKAYFPSQLPI